MEGTRTPGVISVKRMTKRFEKEGRQVEAVRDFSLDVGEREFIAIVGPSGCGKSTLLNVMAGLQSATNGEVRIDGEKIDGPYTNLGIVFQNHVLLEWLTTFDNIMFQADMRRLPRRRYVNRANELLQMVGLTGFEASYPYELSGGMKQRASICRALLHDPPYLFMDEPFGALDALTREQLCIDLERIWLASPKTVIFITHSIREAVQLADRVIVMTPRPGRIAREVKVNLPRPRFELDATDSRLNELVSSIKETFVDQGVLKG